MEIHADVLLKPPRSMASDGSPEAQRCRALLAPDLSWSQRNLKVMDSTAIALCRDNKLPVIVFDLHQAGNIARVASGDDSIGTRVDSGLDRAPKPHEPNSRTRIRRNRAEP